MIARLYSNGKLPSSGSGGAAPLRAPVVEQSAGKVSGAWLFRDTRVPGKALFENLEDGATVDQFLKWFPGVTREQVDGVIEFTTASLEPAVGR